MKTKITFNEYWIERARSAYIAQTNQFKISDTRENEIEVSVNKFVEYLKETANPRWQKNYKKMYQRFIQQNWPIDTINNFYKEMEIRCPSLDQYNKQNKIKQ
jgi:hypothetical protein